MQREPRLLREQRKPAGSQPGVLRRWSQLRVPELLRHDLNGSLTEIYQAHYDLIYTSMHLSFYPTSMPPQAAEALGVMEGRPALLLRRLNYDQHGRILDYDIEYWRHDSLRIEVDTH